MRKVQLYISLVLFFTNNYNYAQTNWTDWVDGVIYLSSGDTLKGKIIYEEDIEVVQYLDNKEGIVKSYSSFIVNGFEIKGKKKLTTYKRYYWNRGFQHHKRVPDFFQTLYDGKLKLLTKEKKIIVTDDFLSPLSPTLNPLGSNFYPVYREKTVYYYFLMDENGDISLIRDSKKFFLEKYPFLKNDIKEMSKKNKNKHDAVKIILIIKLLEERLN